MEDTICAISTAKGVGAISIIRISGKDAFNIIKKIYKGKDLDKVISNTINYGYIYDKDELIDEVLVSILKAPKTYTMEDIVEINSHGGINTTNRILELVLEHGARLAEPGEFTKRAFLNGRIDLTKAEAVNDLINAKSDLARKVALNNIKGDLYNKIKSLRNNIGELMANIEVNIDYPEYEDIEVITNEVLKPALDKVKEEINKILKNTKNAKLINNGINIALIGRPNTGKSSILNKFLDEEKAIVTEIPGTTRDIVEGSMTLDGFELNFIDTAGIRETSDVVEKIGVEKSKKAIDSADIVIVVLNNSEELTKEDEELINVIPENKRIIFVNKSDLPNKLEIKDNYILGNTIDYDGIDNLKKAIKEKLNLDNIMLNDMTYMSNIREIDLLKKALDSIESALNNLDCMPIDMVEIDITNAWNYLGEITGEVYQDELLDILFSNFCVGK